MYSFPLPSEPQRSYVICIDAALVPLISGLFAKMCERRVWNTDDDYEQGYNTFTHLRGCMLACPMEELLKRQDRLYMLLDRAFYGTEYIIQSNEPLVINPAIPDVPDSIPALPGNLAQLEDARLKLQQLIDLQTTEGGLDADMLQQLISIAGLLA